MNTKLLFTTVLGSAALVAAHAQQPAMPSTPAPTVVQAPQAAPAPAPNPTQTVYTPRLPTANDLTNAAAAQGVTVERIEQGANQMTATYRYANGQTNTVVYQVLPPAGAPAQGQAMQTQGQVVQGPPPAVVYEQAPRTVYVEDYYGPRYYPYPYAYYPPVSLSLGFGYRGGFYGGYHHRFR